MRTEFDQAQFLPSKLFLAFAYWGIVMFIGPTLQLPYDIYKRTSCGKKKSGFYASKSRIFKRTFIHLIMSSVGFVYWYLIRYYKLNFFKPELANYDQWWYFLFESFAFLIFFPIILLAVILSCKYALVDEDEYHQLRLIALLNNREIIERVVEDADNKLETGAVQLQEVMHYKIEKKDSNGKILRNPEKPDGVGMVQYVKDDNGKDK
jgi:hypothetical protein